MCVQCMRTRHSEQFFDKLGNLNRVKLIVRFLAMNRYKYPANCTKIERAQN